MGETDDEVRRRARRPARRRRRHRHDRPVPAADRPTTCRSPAGGRPTSSTSSRVAGEALGIGHVEAVRSSGRATTPAGRGGGRAGRQPAERVLRRWASARGARRDLTVGAATSTCSSWRPRRAADGHVNLSPKGLDTFRVLDAHTRRLPRPHRERRRDDRPPPRERADHADVLRVRRAAQHPPPVRDGRGARRATPARRRRSCSRDRFPDHPGARSVDRASTSTGSQTSCGFAVPLMTYERAPAPAHRVGRVEGTRRAALVPGREERDQHRRAARPSTTERWHPDASRLTPSADRFGRARARHGRRRGRRAAALGRPRPPVAHRLRGDAARAAHDARGARDGRRHAGRARGSRRRGSSSRARTSSTVDAVGRDRRSDRHRGRTSSGRTRAWPSATAPGRGSWSSSRTRSRRAARFARAATVIGPLRVVKDATEIEALRRAARRRRRDRRRAAGGRADLVGRTEAEVSAELGRRMLEPRATTG